jgi:hypothetical protein
MPREKVLMPIQTMKEMVVVNKKEMVNPFKILFQVVVVFLV